MKIKTGTIVLILAVLIVLVAVWRGDSDEPPFCEGDPILITNDCVDARLSQPDTTAPELRNDPLPHYYIEGNFPGTDARFTLHCPLPENYGGRFIQYTHPLLGSLLQVPPVSIAFALESGACFVWTNQGGSDNAISPQQTQDANFDPAYGGYRVNAAAAKATRQVAAELYGEHRTHGYLYGGSGGAYQAICSAEHSEGVWDGYVPFVMGTPHAIPSLFTVRVHALRILRQRDKFPEIVDAIDPGGSGDPYATLNQEEAEALREATRMGFPPRGWWSHETLTGGALSLIAGYVPLRDPKYIDDYFSTPGYLGFDDPYGSVAAARNQGATDHSADLALQTYHRHQVPPSRDFVGWDQFRDDAGNPVYPQRDVLIGPGGALNGGGCIGSGRFADPMIVIQNLMDIDAFPWQADWYHRKVKEVQGDSYDERYRLWFTDHAQHTSPPPSSTAAFARVINYQSVLQHALRDLSAWVEQGETPPANTPYEVVDAQVVVPASAAERKGIQPVVTLRVNGGERADVRVGEEVHFEVTMQSPQDAGDIVAVEWDFAGIGDFAAGSTPTGVKPAVTLNTTYTYRETGTYFAVARGTQQRESDPEHAYARVQNLARVRVVVTQ